MAGLLAGLALPQLAALMQPWLPEMVIILLFVTALRLGHGAVAGALRELRTTLAVVVGLQMALPLCLLGLATLSGTVATPWVLAVVLATSAPPVSGSPNLALLLRQDAGAMMRIMILGTAVFPLTVLPLLLLMPQLGAASLVLLAAAKLLAVILVFTGGGFLVRYIAFPRATAGQVKALDGLAVLAFSGIVVGLMAALNPALWADPQAVILWALLAFGLSYGLQALIHLLPWSSPRRGPVAIGAGNRNIALFLVALPDSVVAPIMVFVGCWQLPMYLAPILLRRLYSGATMHE